MPQPSWSTLIKHQLVTATVRSRQGGHTIWGEKRIRKLRLDAYQPTLSAQLCRGVPTSVHKTWTGLCWELWRPVEKGKCGFQMWGAVERYRISEPIVSKTEGRDQTQRTEFKKTIFKILCACMGEKKYLIFAPGGHGSDSF